MNPSYIEDLNGSDYVCMTRSTPQAVSKLAALNPVSLPTSQNTVKVSNNNNSTAMQLTSKNLQTLQQEQLNAGNLSNDIEIKASSISPTPSQLSNNSSNKRESAIQIHKMHNQRDFWNIFFQKKFCQRNHFCHTV